MEDSRFPKVSRRRFLAGTAALASAMSSPLWAEENAGPLIEAPEPPVQANIAGFRAHRWQPYFSSLKNGAILVDTKARSLHYWNEDETIFLVFPTSVPLTEEMTRRGRTEVVQKVVGPSWRPTPSMIERNPEWPPYIGPGPDNPLGTHALYLSWQYYRIHGTHDTRKIGRQASSGCIGLYNEDISVLFERAKVGTQVVLI